MPNPATVLHQIRCSAFAQWLSASTMEEIGLPYRRKTQRWRCYLEYRKSVEREAAERFLLQDGGFVGLRQKVGFGQKHNHALDLICMCTRSASPTTQTSLSVEKHPTNQMLGEREIIDGKAGKYVWLTYKEVYDTVLNVGQSIYNCGIKKLSSQFLLFRGKMWNIWYKLHKMGCKHTEATKVTESKESKDAVELPMKMTSDICTIMYTSGTTGEPKGVMITNESILSMLSGVTHHLDSMSEEDIKLLIDDLKELKPTVFCVVPRVLDRIYSGLMKEGVGGKMRLILSGAAPLSPSVETVTCAHVLQGYEYYKREDLIKEVLVDGWFHTGDIGEWQPDGSMKIIDRKKNMFKLSQGEYVSVENLETIFFLVPSIDSIWVYGNSFESFLVAVVNPNKESLEQWVVENGVSGDFSTICENPKTNAYILGELLRIAKEKKLTGFEIVKAVHIDAVPFDMERDLLTPTFKKKRAQFLKYYQSVVNGMYKSK
ncbi:hypothetical protein LXL04_030792 [Taraxacum kok-saghyz]